ncbi:hypothetical protein ACB092_06G054200 [Castanea dentata]
MKKPKSKQFRNKLRVSERETIKLLDSWIQSQKPDSGSNPMSLPPLPSNSPIGCLGGDSFSRYAGATRFDQLPLSKKTVDGLRDAGFVEMTDVQRATLPHALCGRDILGAAKTGSGKTLAFVIPVLEKLYRETWGPEDGVGSIIISPTRELAGQLFDVLKTVGKRHNFSAGLLIGGRKDIDTEKEHVNRLNILVCTPGRLLQHMDETPNFECSLLQVKFVYEAFKKLRPGIPLKCLHGRMKQGRRMGIYSEFCEQRSVLFSTDVASRGLDFNKAVDWVVQVDCPEDVKAYIHRAGRTARYHSGGRSVLFLMPSEMKMLEKLQAQKVPIQFIKANKKRLQPVSGLLSALLVKYPDMQYQAQRAFVTYLRSIHIQKEKEIFDVTKLPIDEFSASLGLPMTPKIRFLKQKNKSKTASETISLPASENSDRENLLEIPKEILDIGDIDEEEMDKAFLLKQDTPNEEEEKMSEITDARPATRISKKKKLKINIHRPMGTRLVYDDEGNALPPLARVAEIKSGNQSFVVDQGKKNEYYNQMREEMKQVDKEDKLLDRQRRREKRIKQKMKLKRGSLEEEDDEEHSASEEEATRDRPRKKSKKYYNSDSDDGERKENKDSSSLAEQEALALKLLNAMHS